MKKKAKERKRPYVNKNKLKTSFKILIPLKKKAKQRATIKKNSN